MNLNDLRDHVHEHFGGDAIVLSSRYAHDEADDAIEAFFAGRLSRSALMETLLRLRVPASQICRVLSGERLITTS